MLICFEKNHYDCIVFFFFWLSDCIVFKLKKKIKNKKEKKKSTSGHQLHKIQTIGNSFLQFLRAEKQEIIIIIIIIIRNWIEECQESNYQRNSTDKIYTFFSLVVWAKVRYEDWKMKRKKQNNWRLKLKRNNLQHFVFWFCL
jgi:hypothetical protein